MSYTRAGKKQSSQQEHLNRVLFSESHKGHAKRSSPTPLSKILIAPQLELKTNT